MKANRLIFPAVALFLTISAALFAQTAASIKPRVAVFGFLNLTGDAAFDTPSEIATDNLDLSLRTLGSYDVRESDMILRSLNDASLLKYARANGMDSVLYGTLVAKDDGTQLYTLAVFDANRQKTVISETAKGSSPLDVFSATDTLIRSVLDSITGHHVGFGSLRLVNAGISADYSVSIDGNALKDNASAVEYIAEGTHEIRIVRLNPPAGLTDEEKTVGQSVTVREGETAEVAFAFADPAPEPQPIPLAASETPEEATPPATESKTDAEKPAPVVPAPEQPKPRNDHVYIGLYGVNQYALGDYAKMAICTLGGGISCDIRPFANFPLALVGRVQANATMPNDETISSYWNAAALAGLSFPVNLNDDLVFAPEAVYGVWAHKIDSPTTLGETVTLLGQDVYLDYAVQVSLALRAYAGCFGLEVAPVGTMLLESGNMPILIGLRFGFSFRF